MSTKTIPHNLMTWHVCVNRHPTTRGALWGWIDGAPGDITWSNDHGSGFTSADARRVAEEHNQWLERQAPIERRIAAQREKVRAAEAQLSRAAQDAAAAAAAAERARAQLAELESEHPHSEPEETP